MLALIKPQREVRSISEQSLKNITGAETTLTGNEKIQLSVGKETS